MNISNEHLMARIKRSQAAISGLADHLDTIANICSTIETNLAAGATLWTAGNGGSAAQALHLSEELVGRYRADRQPLASAMLCGEATSMTCIANDFGFDQIFARPLRALARPGDLLMVLSTSGNSPNLINALEVAATIPCTTIGLLGKDGGSCAERCDHTLVINESDSACIQDAHQIVIHLLCEHLDIWATSKEGTVSQ